MKRRHVLTLVLTATGLAAVVVHLSTLPPRAADAPVIPPPTSITPGDLCRAASSGRLDGVTVRVPFDSGLAPTADPSVWEYRPGHTGLLPPAVRVEFVAPPTFGLRPGCVVVGRVAGLVPDGRRRPSGASGWVRLTAAEVVPPRSP